MTLIEGLAARFEAPAELIAAYIEVNFPLIDRDIDVESWIATLSPAQYLYVSYALSTNQRATAVLQEVHRFLPTGLFRHLDIGCGYGGLLRAFSSAGGSSVGIEIDKQLSYYSEQNTLGLDVNIINKSVTDVNFEALGSFDVITCTEVLEHVPDPLFVVSNICRSLNSGGIAFIRVPNGQAIDFVAADGHFLLFGISLLSRQEAREYKRIITGVDDNYSHMGEYYRYNFYTDYIRSFNLTVEMKKDQVGREIILDEIPGKLANMHTAFHLWSSESSKINFFSRTEILRSYAEFSAKLYESYSSAIEGAHDNALEEFYRDYVQKFWTIIARR